jgi:cytosine/adenosine deaminase-related metal-dependent hydrolase
MMMGHGMPPIQKFLDRGHAPSLSIDVETNVPNDMFNQMRSVLALQHALAGGQGKELIRPADVLAFATIEGARANGLDHKTGSLTPGKQADIILLRTDRMNVLPLDDPATAVVVGMDTGNVDSVLIAGRIMKRGGRLVGVNWPALMDASSNSRDRVIAKSGFKVPKI